ncbi:hypothetical protein N5A93_01705 [Roseovarius sp. EGI FJ00037]|nr:hypothetical protein [Roseovarius sp. EGI FJ00037]
MARWAQNPPSGRQVRFVLAIILICLALLAYEHVFGWPETLSTDPRGRLWKP